MLFVFVFRVLLPHCSAKYEWYSAGMIESVLVSMCVCCIVSMCVVIGNCWECACVCVCVLYCVYVCGHWWLLRVCLCLCVCAVLCLCVWSLVTVDVQQLQESCSRHVEHVISESSLDFVQDVQLARACKVEVHQLGTMSDRCLSVCLFQCQLICSVCLAGSVL